MGINNKRTVPAFRAQAWEHHVHGSDGLGIPKVSPPWSWEILALLGAMVVSALAFAFLGKVEVNEKGPGVLRPVTGIRHLQAQASGVVLDVPGRAGTAVEVGDICVEIDAADLNAPAMEAEENLRLFGAAYAELEQRQAETFALRKANLKARAAKLEIDLSARQRSVERSQKRLAAARILHGNGIVPDADLDKAMEDAEEVEHQHRDCLQALRQVRQEQEDADGTFRREAWNHHSERARAISRRKALVLNARQQVIQAPVGGFLDAVLVRRGDGVHRGQVVARIVPRDSELRVIAFLGESHRSWVKEGDPVQLEVSQFPYHEFGSLSGRVLSLGMDFASPEEIKTALGEGTSLKGPVFQVEVQVLSSQKGPLAELRLRPGMRADVRFTLRRQRPIAFVFGPAERWLR
ncbi:MAG: HlyD family efflux transporter periplasmic adaptor subunit [Holophaga sp.]|nr:HlyD family efflux transporter periplasmic adaptor subunit [Holophaga sp.]